MLLHDYVDRWAAQRPDGEFAVQGERRATWAQARDASAGAAGVLQRAGLAPGDRCAVLARNAIEYVLLYVAASRAGVVLVPLNPRSTVAEWDQVVADAAAHAPGPRARLRRGRAAGHARRRSRRAVRAAADRRPRTPARPSCCACSPAGRRAGPRARR